nr:multiple exostoses homolog 1 [Caenorhabditis elegans]
MKFHLVIFMLFGSVRLQNPTIERKQCTMSNCFDFSKCSTSKKVYIHPMEKRFEESPQSVIYSKILKHFLESNHYTNDPNEACIFLLGIDTTDRDVRSQNYVKNVNDYIESLDPSVWNNGRNHLIFNFYHGTFPDYDDHNLNFDTGEAMIARASSSENNFIKVFDVSLPLFHENHPYEIKESKSERNDDRIENQRKYLVSFKGKRYVYGIGSGTRNLVHHLHNGDDIVMVTTCKHNNDWQVYQDDRCQRDNDEYDRWEYDELLANSTFCLVPRGRRLGSFRFLETLRSGCVPVVISDSWILPFSETIDWNSAAIVVAERDALSIPELLMSTSRRRVKELRESARNVYDAYLRSIQVISDHVLRIIFKRIDNKIELEDHQ